MTAPFTVAIDGPAAAGKGTIAKAIAGYFGFAHLDTGLLYRAVGAATLEGVDPIEAARSLSAKALDAPDLRTPDVAQAASKVAVIPEVRAALLDFQKAFARRAGGAVLDGRDICTVIVPQAEVKLFVTASPEIRARRRLEELHGRGLAAEYGTVLEDVKARDARDSQRHTAPLKASDDAIVLDTSDMLVGEAIAKAIALVEARRV